MRNLRFRKD